MTFLLTFDPGKSTGIALGEYSDTDPYKLLLVWQTHNGLTGVLEWLGEHYGMVDDDEVVSEKFVLRKHNFLPDTEPLRIEGALTVFFPDIVWQLPSEKHHTPDNVLREHNLWQTGKKFNHQDGRDANDAIIHALTFLKKQAHMPTLKKYWGAES
jgi:hypothetical protein